MVLVMCSGAAKSQEEAERICEALRTAGVVLRAYDIVYLKPEEITDTILRVRMHSGHPPCCMEHHMDRLAGTVRGMRQCYS